MKNLLEQTCQFLNNVPVVTLESQRTMDNFALICFIELKNLHDGVELNTLPKNELIRPKKRVGIQLK